MLFAASSRRDSAITVYGDGEGLAREIATCYVTLGYSDVALLGLACLSEKSHRPKRQAGDP